MNDTFITRYYGIKGNKDSDNNNTHIKCELYYNIGSEYIINGKEDKRGYYISIRPVKRDDYFETYEAWTGWKDCVKPVKRKSKKAKEFAEEMFFKHVEKLCKNLFPEYKIDKDNYEERRQY